MKLTELRKLEIGTILNLKGTDVIFELLEVDSFDDKRPCSIKVLESDKPILFKIGDLGDDFILNVDSSYEHSGWIFNNKTLIREDVNMTRYEFDNYVKLYRYVVTLRDLEVFKGVDIDSHIDPRDLIYKPANEPEETYTANEFDPFDISKARELSEEHENDRETIALINHAIEFEAKRGLREVLFEELPTISKAVKEKYRLAGYTITERAIKW